MKQKKEAFLDWELYREGVPLPNQEKKRESRKRVLHEAVRATYYLTDGQFLLCQIGLMKKRTVLVQLLVMAVFCTTVVNGYCADFYDRQLLAMVSAVTPLFLVFQIEEIAKVYTGSMLELEMAAKFSLKKLVVARMMILGFVDMMLILFVAGFMGMRFKAHLYALLLYALVPFQVCLVIIFAMLVWKHREYFIQKAPAVILFVSLCFGKLSSGRFNIYGDNNLVFWGIAYIVALVITVGLINKMKQQAEQMEGLLAV